MTRNTFAVVYSSTNWNLTSGCVDELNFWKNNLVHINGVPLWPVFRHSCWCKFRDFSEPQCNDRGMVSAIITSSYKPTYEERRLLKFTVFYRNQINLED